MTEVARLGIYDILDEIYGGEGEGKNSQETHGKSFLKVIQHIFVYKSAPQYVFN